MNIVSGDSIQSRIDKYKLTTGFDYLRLGLALSVLIIHSVAISYGRSVEAAWIWQSGLAGFARIVLPMFFALSGFLVAGSIFRSGSISGFVLLRMIRIVPALAVEVSLSAIVLGGIFTTLPLSEYYKDPVFISYFKNIYGNIHFLLPGVFTDNPLNEAINISLWTIPAEFECYAVLILLMVTRLIRARSAVLILVIIGCIAFFLRKAYFWDAVPSNIGAVEPKAMVLAFLAGVTLYLYRDKVKMNFYAFAICFMVALALYYNRQTAYLASFPAAYATVYLGMLMPKKAPFIFEGDYSYGMYLYAFPIQQTITHLMPDHRIWWLNIILAIPTTFAFSYCSWHLVEKHAMKLKNQTKPDSLIPSIERTIFSMPGRIISKMK